MLVHVVGEDPDLRMAQEHVGEAAQLGLGIGRAGGVRGRVEDDPAGARGDRGFERVRRQLVLGVRAAGGDDGFAASHQHHFRIRDPVRRGHDDFVAGVQCGHEGVVDDRLAARRDMHLGWLVGEAVLAEKLGADGLFQLGQAVGRRVFGLAFADRLDGRFLDIVRRVEIGLSGAEANDVMAGALEFSGLGGDGDRGGRLDAFEGVGEADVCGHYMKSRDAVWGLGEWPVP